MLTLTMDEIEQIKNPSKKRSRHEALFEVNSSDDSSSDDDDDEDKLVDRLSEVLEEKVTSAVSAIMQEIKTTHRLTIEHIDRRIGEIEKKLVADEQGLSNMFNFEL